MGSKKIEKGSVVRKLFHRDGPSQGKDDNRDKNNAQGGKSQRPKRLVPVRRTNDVVNLEKMSSEAFLNLLGEGTAPDIIQKSKLLAAEKKRIEQLRNQNLITVNTCILDEVPAAVTEDGTQRGRTDPEVTDVEKSPTKVTRSPVLPDKSKSPFKTSVLSVNASPVRKQVATGSFSVSPLHAANHKDDEDLDATQPVDSGNETGPNSVIHEVTQSESQPKEDEAGQNLLSKHAQTEYCLILCTCKKCRTVLAEFSKMMKTGRTTDCSQGLENGPESEVEENPTKPTSGGQQESNTSLGSSNGGNDEQLIPLYKGSQVKLSVTAKAKLKSVLSNDPKDYVAILMESFYTNTEMAQMTAEGRTKGSVKMDPKVKDAFYVYLYSKFPDFETKDLTELINKKCYCERRKAWKEDNTDVRRPLVKKVRDPSRPANNRRKLKTSFSKKGINSRTNRNEDSRRHDERHGGRARSRDARRDDVRSKIRDKSKLQDTSEPSRKGAERRTDKEREEKRHHEREDRKRDREREDRKRYNKEREDRRDEEREKVRRLEEREGRRRDAERDSRKRDAEKEDRRREEKRERRRMKDEEEELQQRREEKRGLEKDASKKRDSQHNHPQMRQQFGGKQPKSPQSLSTLMERRASSFTSELETTSTPEKNLISKRLPRGNQLSNIDWTESPSPKRLRGDFDKWSEVSYVSSRDSEYDEEIEEEEETEESDYGK